MMQLLIYNNNYIKCSFYVQCLITWFSVSSKESSTFIVIIQISKLSINVSVYVSGRPGPPGGVRVEEIRDTSVKLSWSLGSDHGNTLIQHIIQTRDFYALDPEDWKTALTSECTGIPFCFFICIFQ